MPRTTLEFSDRLLNCPLCDGPIHHWAGKIREGQEFQYDRCGECEFVFVNPRATLNALAEYYGAANSSEPAPVISADLRQIGKWPVKAIAQMLKLRPAPGHLLDIGAADGGFSLAAIRAGLEVTALEVDPNDVRSLEAIRGVHIVQSMFEGFDPPPESFDYVLMSHVLEHAYEPKRWIEKAAAALRPGGVLAIMLPHFDSIYRYLGGTRDPYFVPPEHLNHFNVRSLSRLCEQFGMKVVRLETASGFKNDVLVKRVALPAPLVPVVRGLTSAASALLDWTTWAGGIGSVLILHARKK
ncbi:MAG: class I SAM-dependent methyltransferase [Planctomycetota bacterium]|nr:class I SAM-dependent methyltransferase [Planctomycetota bacterium]